MRVRNITTCALGLAAALTLVSSSLAAQSQDTTKLRKTTRSERGIPISKESPGWCRNPAKAWAAQSTRT